MTNDTRETIFRMYCNEMREAIRHHVLGPNITECSHCEILSFEEQMDDCKASFIEHFRNALKYFPGSN
jgi:hypothetical protein